MTIIWPAEWVWINLAIHLLNGAVVLILQAGALLIAECDS